MTPTILITIHSRYYELLKNLPVFVERAEKYYGYRPPVVIVWACPTPGYEWVFNELCRRKLIDWVIERPRVEGEDGTATSYPESVNIRLGLKFIQLNYPDTYTIVSAADICPTELVFPEIAVAFVRKYDGMVFQWANGQIPGRIWHTNFFIVKNQEESHWPPLIAPKDPDVLEARWMRHLETVQCNLMSTHNSGQWYFTHVHESETVPPVEMRPAVHHECIPLFTGGCIKVGTRIKNLVRRLLWLK